MKHSLTIAQTLRLMFFSFATFLFIAGCTGYLCNCGGQLEWSATAWKETITCPSCHGNGRLYGGYECSTCQGTGRSFKWHDGCVCKRCGAVYDNQ